MKFDKTYILLGRPGAGKDTQAKLLESRLGLKVVFLGNIVRKKAQKDKEIAKNLKKGQLVDNKKINELIVSELKKLKPSETVVFDGFPRNVEQAKWFDDFYKKHDLEIEGVIYISIDNKNSLQRLVKRGRQDDQEELIKKRLEVFDRQTKPVLDYYDSTGLLRVADGIGSVEEVFNRIKSAL